ncbi:MAG: hypothetical protein DHS20C15_31850 [Planctomycetota bacterium]|nr:MAG: hypothetical protein DHS20C15_31850 [Planctomycetota bacterium]
MRALLDGHPQVLAVPRETHAFEWCESTEPTQELMRRKLWAEMPWPDDERERFESTLHELLPGPAHPADALEAVVEGLVRLDPEQRSREVWLEKTPTHLRVLPPLVERLGQRTRVICLVRDPRGILASRVRRWRRSGLRAVRHFARKWARDDELTRSMEYAPEVHVVRYEELVSEPERAMRDVAEHLDIPWHDVLTEPQRDGENFGGREKFQGVSAVSRDRWRDELSGEQLHELERFIGPRLEARGYPVDERYVRPDATRRLFEWRVKGALQLLKLGWLRYGRLSK